MANEHVIGDRVHAIDELSTSGTDYIPLNLTDTVSLLVLNHFLGGAGSNL